MQDEWNGLKPQKFKGNRKHLRPVDELEQISNQGMLPILGRKHLTQKPSDVYGYKYSIKVSELRNKQSF